jgi:predicted Rossmann fold flavoprotein
MNASRVWHRAALRQCPVTVTANLLPGRTFDSLNQHWLDLSRARPKTSVQSALGEALPARVAERLLLHIGLGPQVPLAHLSKDQRYKLLHALLEWPLPVRDSRGYLFAEATAGGVPLNEIDPATMQSRLCHGLYLVGEILDVDGRIGGFNFQWAWSSAHVAATGLKKIGCDRFDERS